MKFTDCIPVKSFALPSQNCRVESQSLDANRMADRFNAEICVVEQSLKARKEIVERIYGQILFSPLAFDRNKCLDSQFVQGSITVKDFVRSLLLSRRFVEGYYQCSSNERVVRQVIGRALGRPVHGEAEARSLSIIVAQQGLAALVDQILDGEEYMSCFGYDIVPFQRNRILPGRAFGEVPIDQQLPRYGEEWLEVLQSRVPGLYEKQPTAIRSISGQWKNNQPPEWTLRIWLVLIAIGSFELLRVVLSLVFLALKTS